MTRPLLLVALGGALGSLARYGIAEWLGAGHPGPATLIVNLVGCFLIGLVVSVLDRDAHALRALLGAGFLGGFTTFSTFSVDVRSWLADGEVLKACAYVVVSVVGGLVAVWLGLLLGPMLGRTSDRPSSLSATPEDET
jgi:CrcB protein